VKLSNYKTVIDGGAHWSLMVRRGMQMTLTDIKGGANVGMLFYNPILLSEKYNAPDTLKCQHTFKLTQGHCLYSDMGRIFCSKKGDSITLRFEMDTLVVLHTCPHPLNRDAEYPHTPIEIFLEKAAPVLDDDLCMNSRPERLFY